VRFNKTGGIQIPPKYQYEKYPITLDCHFHALLAISFTALDNPTSYPSMMEMVTCPQVLSWGLDFVFQVTTFTMKVALL
jgi:hypothetical protein